MRLLVWALILLAGCGAETIAPVVDISGVPMGLKVDASIERFAYDMKVDGTKLYVATDGPGIAIYDISTPTSPVLLGELQEDALGITVAASGSLAIMPNADMGMACLDVSDPESIAIVGMDYGSIMGVACQIVGSTGYAISGGTGGALLYTYDLSDPENPLPLDTVSIGGNPMGLAISGNYAYVSAAGRGGTSARLSIVSIADPENLSVSGRVNLPGSGRDVAVSGNYAYVTADSYGLQVVDVSNPASPAIAGSVVSSGALYSIAVSGDYAYTAGWDEGLIVLDISTPASPAELYALDLSADASKIVVSGDYAYVATDSGIEIISIAEVEDFTITATAGAHGSISPSGSVAVPYSGDQTFTITPHAGWQVAYLLVDGVSVGSLTTYTFEDVVEDHTIQAVFGKQVIYGAESALSKTISAESALSRNITAESALCRTVSAKSALAQSLTFESALCRTVSAKSGFTGTR